MPCDDNQSLPKLFCETPLEHQVQDVMHVFRHAGSESGCEHSYALEDGLLVGCILFAVDITVSIAWGGLQRIEHTLSEPTTP